MPRRLKFQSCLNTHSVFLRAGDLQQCPPHHSAMRNKKQGAELSLHVNGTFRSSIHLDHLLAATVITEGKTNQVNKHK